jgi:hypothetical protein
MKHDTTSRIRFSTLNRPSRRNNRDIMGKIQRQSKKGIREICDDYYYRCGYIDGYIDALKEILTKKKIKGGVIKKWHYNSSRRNKKKKQEK